LLYGTATRGAGALSPVARVRTRTAVLGGSPCRACVGQGTDAEPLDGGALTLRWTRSPARGPAAAPPPPPPRPPPAAAAARHAEKDGRGEKNETLGFRGAGRQAVLIRRDRRATVGCDPMVAVGRAETSPRGHWGRIASGRIGDPAVGCRAPGPGTGSAQ